MVRARGDVKVVALEKDQLVDLCLMVKGFKEGFLPKNVAKEVSMLEMMQMMMKREDKQKALMRQ